MKKNLLLSFVCFCITLIANAQINKGSVLLGGSINFSNSKETVSNPDRKQNSIGLSPQVGIAFRQNLIAGIQFGYSHSKNQFNPSVPQENKNNFYITEVFLRKYLPIGKNFYLFGQTGLYYRNSKYTYDYVTYLTERKDQTLGIGVYPGISYAVTKNFHLEVGLADLIKFEYFKYRYINAGVKTEDTRGVSFNATASSLSNLNIGFRFFLAKK